MSGSDFDLALEALCLCKLRGADPFEEFGAEAATDAINLVSAVLHAREKDSPGKVWWYSEVVHPAIYRALRIDRADYGATFAAAPFRLHRGDQGTRILAAFPCPRILAPHDNDDWLEIETVLSWNPVDDTVEVLGDPSPALVGADLYGLDRLDLYASPFAYFRAEAEARAQWLTAWQRIESNWRQRPTEPRHYADAMLLIGSVDKVRWPISSMPDSVAAHGIDAKALNAAMLRQARIPRAVAAPRLQRAA